MYKYFLFNDSHSWHIEVPSAKTFRQAIKEVRAEKSIYGRIRCIETNGDTKTYKLNNSLYEFTLIGVY